MSSLVLIIAIITCYYMLGTPELADVVGYCNWRREERPIGSRTGKMLRDLLWRARGLAQHVAAANACAKVRTLMHKWSI